MYKDRDWEIDRLPYGYRLGDDAKMIWIRYITYPRVVVDSSFQQQMVIQTLLVLSLQQLKIMFIYKKNQEMNDDNRSERKTWID